MPDDVMREADSLAPLQKLLIPHAGKGMRRHALLWRLDARLADIVRTTREPVIGQMRLTWWHDALTDGSGVKGRGEPLVDALRTDGFDAAAIPPLIDGWEALLEPAPLGEDALRSFALGRGGGLFRALAGEGEAPAWIDDAGALWALWDLAGHASDRALAGQAMTLARSFVDGLDGAARWTGALRPQRILAGLARHDVMRGKVPHGGMTPGLYARFLRIALIGR